MNNPNNEIFYLEAMSTTFISAEEIQEKNLAHEPIRMVDCRYYLTDTSQGLMEYLEGHLPGAIYAHLDEDLSAPITKTTGRHPLPELSAFKYWLSNNGISPKFEVFAYDNQGGGYAARLWLMLRQLGYRAYVLEGGIDRYISLGYDISVGRESYSPLGENELETLIISWNDGEFEIVDTNQIENDIEAPHVEIIDSRAPERHTGENETIDPVAGRIPSSKNLYWKSNLTDDLMLLPDEELQDRFIDTNKKKVYYCGSGVTACFNLLLNEHLGKQKAGVYIGSWSEWINLKPDLIQKG